MPILLFDEFDFVSGSPAQTARIGERLGELMQPGDVVRLDGALGAGKTCLAQGVAHGWGALDEATSPTFTLIHELRRADDYAVLYHIDLYRIESENEAKWLGLSDLFDGRAACVIEWAEHAPGLIADDCLRIRLTWVDDTRRQLSFSATGERYEQLLAELKRLAFGAGG